MRLDAAEGRHARNRTSSSGRSEGAGFDSTCSVDRCVFDRHRLQRCEITASAGGRGSCSALRGSLLVRMACKRQRDDRQDPGKSPAEAGHYVLLHIPIAWKRMAATVITIVM